MWRNAVHLHFDVISAGPGLFDRSCSLVAPEPTTRTRTNSSCLWETEKASPSVFRHPRLFFFVVQSATSKHIAKRTKKKSQAWAAQPGLVAPHDSSSRANGPPKCRLFTAAAKELNCLCTRSDGVLFFSLGGFTGIVAGGVRSGFLEAAVEGKIAATGWLAQAAAPHARSAMPPPPSKVGSS